MKQNDNLVKLAKITNTAASFLIFLAGLMLIFLPSTEVTSLQRTVLAVLFLLTGAAKMIGYYSNDLYRLAFQFDFAIGILCALLAGLLAFLPQRVLPTLPVLLSVYVILDALLKLQIAMDARRFGMESWIAILCSSLLLGFGGLFGAVFQLPHAVRRHWHRAGARRAAECLDHHAHGARPRPQKKSFRKVWTGES